MKIRTSTLASLLFACAISCVQAQDAPAKPFDGKSLENWETKAKPKGKDSWVVGAAAQSATDPKTLSVLKPEGDGAMINNVTGHGQSWDIYSKEKFGSCRIEVEVMVPKGANSGIYVMGEYEVQVLDSWGKEKLGGGDMGAIYGAQPPKVNASKKPGEWQKYVIDFKAPSFDASGKKTSNAKFIKVELNGQTLHENVEVPASTGGALTGKESPTGPLMFQGDHGAVAYRNIVVTPK